MKVLDKLKENPTLRNVLLFLAVLGPGIITGSVDNDAGGITTYSVAGANYGYKLIWTLIPSFLLLVIVQEMNARMGIVTGKGLADLIRENFGVKITFVIFLGLVARGYRQHGDRVRRGRGKPHDLRGQQIYLRADRRLRGLDPRHQGQL